MAHAVTNQSDFAGDPLQDTKFRIYTANHKKVEPFYFSNNFVKYQHTWIIFGTRVA